MNHDTTARNIATRRFTLEEATAMLPLVRSIVTDICGAVRDVNSRRVELHRLLRKGHRGAGRIYDDEMAESRADLQAEFDQIGRFREELESLGVLLRHPEEGRIEFPTEMGERDAFYSWQLGEPAIAHYRLASEPTSTRWPIGSHQN
jgi:hypothetical protein